MNKLINNCLSSYISIFLPSPPQEISLYQTVPNFHKRLSNLTLIYIFFIFLLFFFSFAIHNILILPSWLFLFYLAGKIFRIRKEFKNNISVWNDYLMIQEFIINNGLYKETSDIFLSAIFKISESEKDIIISAYKMGSFLDQKAEGLDIELSGLLSLDITKKNIFADRVEYVFEKNKREIQQYVFANSDSEENLTRDFFQNIPKDIIKLSNTQQFSLKSNTNIALYGRTGSGKTISLQWLLYNAISKGCGLYPDTYLSIVDGKGADLYSLGEILQETLGEQINIGQTPHSLAKLSREFCQIMNERFELIKNSETLNADAYDLKMTPNFLFVDELASIRDSCGSSKEGKALWNEILQNLGLIARKGRQAGCHLCISTQDPNAENIPVELRNQISAVLYMGSPSADRVRMAFAMCELENVPTVTGRKGEALYYADGENMIEPEITVAPFVDLKTKQEFKQVILNILPNLK
ncbi:FtsK/SpoIIIE domain-containing protein [Lactococcus lactis]|uniref:FtsK/SpoIIIE domain-containing protein n=1 Tax=Lactococcus lactis TaxID=1358 RepID=UPI0021AFFCAD|nr:FtsK/SpoIIIE domain-containing protein [Lactococcus lactis]MCT1181172.1 cell division protein FtsK [Lactococcus lactis]